MKITNLFLAFWLLAGGAVTIGAPLAADHLRVSRSSLPLNFEPNCGQTDSSVRFVAHGPGGDLLLTGNEAWLTFAGGRLGLTFAGANFAAGPEGEDGLPGRANYLFGSDPLQWRTNLPTFARVRYREIYPGIDLVFYGNPQNLEYDLIVKPGANPNSIMLQFNGAEKLSLEADNDLLVSAGGNSIRQHKPVVYQEAQGQRTMVGGTYVLRSAMQAGIELGAYDKTKPLVIDPALGYSATFGGSAFNSAQDIAVDGQGSVYVTGMTTSRNFPTAGYQTNMLGSHSAFVVKFNTNGAVVYSTYLGGGATNDQTTTSTSGQGIAVNATGSAFVTGYTTATNFPVLNAFQTNKAAASYSGRNAFVTKLNPAGNGLIYSTYLGGSGSDTATGIALDANDDAVITGYTSSTNFPTADAAQPAYGGNGDAFVAKFNTNGNDLIYSTYLGGTSYENNDLSGGVATPVGAVAVDFDGNAYVTGLTYSTNFPTSNAFQPTNGTPYYGAYSAAFVSKLDPSGNLLYSTYFGGHNDAGRAIGVDRLGKAYFAGDSGNGGLPSTNAFQGALAGSGDGFVAALDATGTNLIYCTYLGGTAKDQVAGLAVRPADGTVAVAGFTESLDFPLLSALQPTGYQGLFKSVNAANTWNLSNAGLASSVIYSIQIDPANPATVYALTQDRCFKSTDAGATWASASSGLGFASPTGSGAGLLVIDPLHPSTLYAGCSSGVFKSTNGAASWTAVGTGLPAYPSIISMALDISAPTNLYVGTYFNGIYKSTDAGATWNVITNGLNAQTIQAIAVDPNNSSNLFAGAGGFTYNISLFRSTNGGANWNLVGGGLTGGAVYSLTTGGTNLYAVIGDSISYPLGSYPALLVSSNRGVNWSTLFSGAGLNFTALAIAPPSVPGLTIVRSGTNDNLSWPAFFDGYVLQSSLSLNPPNWSNVSQPRTTNNGAYAVTVPISAPMGFYRLLLTNFAAASAPTLYLGTDAASDQGVLRSTDGGYSWDVMGPDGDTVSALAVNPANPATVYAGMNGGRDAFIAVFAPGGQLDSSTYFGGSGLDQANAIAFQNEVTVVTAGATASSDFPTKSIAPAAAAETLEKPVGGRPKTTLIFSDAYIDLASMFVMILGGPLPCPGNLVENYTLHLGDYFEENLSEFQDATLDSTSGAFPPGITEGYVNVFESYDYKISGNVSRTATLGLYTYTYNFKTPDCAWSFTLNITVIP